MIETVIPVWFKPPSGTPRCIALKRGRRPGDGEDRLEGSARRERTFEGQARFRVVSAPIEQEIDGLPREGVDRSEGAGGLEGSLERMRRVPRRRHAKDIGIERRLERKSSELPLVRRAEIELVEIVLAGLALQEDVPPRIERDSGERRPCRDLAHGLVAERDSAKEIAGAHVHIEPELGLARGRLFLLRHGVGGKTEPQGEGRFPHFVPLLSGKTKCASENGQRKRENPRGRKGLSRGPSTRPNANGSPDRAWLHPTHSTRDRGRPHAILGGTAHCDRPEPAKLAATARVKETVR